MPHGRRRPLLSLPYCMTDFGWRGQFQLSITCLQNGRHYITAYVLMAQQQPDLLQS
jgi:hypothetical protein